jgi:hypothetical protein
MGALLPESEGGAMTTRTIHVSTAIGGVAAATVAPAVASTLAISPAAANPAKG